ncbi:hypothetical protein DFQ26_009109 [Actinomortierella ambigua]|nr:hypothetical protein DFQ26_009109 [Actinomortierella ambigua]
MNTLEVAALFHRLDSARYLLENDFASSESNSLSLALNRAKSPDKKSMKTLLRSYQGSEGEKRRLALAQRIQLLQLALNHQTGSPIATHGAPAAAGGEAHSPTVGQHQQTASSASSAHGSGAVASDSASVRSFEGAKDQGK